MKILSFPPPDNSQPVPVLHSPPRKKVFPKVQREPPTLQSVAIAPYCIMCHCQEEFDPIIFIAALQTVVLNLLLLSFLLGLNPERSQDFLYLL